jgi:RNA polymerase sigma factor (sigma-70 family)
MEAESSAERHRWVLETLEQYEGRLLRFATRLMGDEDAARDAVQHAFLRLCDPSAGPRRQKVGPWLFAVCRNYAFDVLRKRKTMSADNHAELADCRGHEPDPAAAAEQSDLYRAVNRLLDGLPMPHREAITLWCEGFNYRQIAKMTNTAEVNVRVRVHRGLKQLREHPVVQKLLSMPRLVQPAAVLAGKGEARS